MQPTWKHLLGQLAVWDATQNFAKGSHQDIILWALSAAYGVLTLIALVVFCYNLRCYVTFTRRKQAGDRDSCDNQINTYCMINSLSLIPFFSVATILRSLTFGPFNARNSYALLGEQYRQLRNNAVDFSMFYFFSIYMSSMCRMWRSYNARNLCSSRDNATLILVDGCLRGRVLVMYSAIALLQLVIYFWQIISSSNGINLYSARLFILLGFLVATIWLHVDEFTACLSNSKESGLEVNRWQAVFSQCETFKTARQKVPRAIKSGIFLGVYSLCVKASFMIIFVIFYQFYDDVLPLELDDVTKLSIGNLVFYSCSELMPLGYVLFLLACSFQPELRQRQQDYLPIHQAEINTSDNGP